MVENRGRYRSSTTSTWVEIELNGTLEGLERNHEFEGGEKMGG